MLFGDLSIKKKISKNLNGREGHCFVYFSGTARVTDDGMLRFFMLVHVLKIYDHMTTQALFQPSLISCYWGNNFAGLFLSNGPSDSCQVFASSNGVYIPTKFQGILCHAIILEKHSLSMTH